MKDAILRKNEVLSRRARGRMRVGNSLTVCVGDMVELVVTIRYKILKRFT